VKPECHQRKLKRLSLPPTESELLVSANFADVSVVFLLIP
jgi:hypothetical protein